MIHSDIWGPSTIPNISGARWFVSLIDDCTRVTWLFLLKQKSDVSNIIPSFHSMIQNQFGVKIKTFRSDNAKDYFNKVLSPYFQKEGIIHTSSCVDTPQQNGIAERKNGHLLNATIALFHGNMPKHYWGEAVLTATYLINRIPSRVLDNKSPMEILNTHYPHFRTSNGLIPRIFGCTAFVHVHRPNRGKLDHRAIKCLFVGYSSTQKGYKCFHPPSRKFYISVDVTFFENKSYFHKNHLQGETTTLEDGTWSESFESSFSPLDLPSTSHLPSPVQEPESANTEKDTDPTCRPQESVGFEPVSSRVTGGHPRFSQVYTRRKENPNLTQVQETNPSPENEGMVSKDLFQDTEIVAAPADDSGAAPADDSHLPIAVRKKSRECSKRPLYPLSHYVSPKRLSPSHQKFIASLNTISIPNTLAEALLKEEWRNAMREELEALEKNHTWEIVERPKGKNIVDCKWVFALKYKADGTLERYKARLVAKGYT